jgi:hypothetical protein
MSHPPHQTKKPGVVILMARLCESYPPLPLQSVVKLEAGVIKLRDYIWSSFTRHTVIVLLVKSYLIQSFCQALFEVRINRYANAGIFKNFLTTKQMYSISKLRNSGIKGLWNLQIFNS